MGGNTRNHYGKSRRFAVCYQLAQEPIYRALLDTYYHTLKSCQNGAQEHLEHMQSIAAIHDWLRDNAKEIKHN